MIQPFYAELLLNTNSRWTTINNRTVVIVGVELPCLKETIECGDLYTELRVYWHPDYWNVKADKFLYGHREFLSLLCASLDSEGYNTASNVDYSELGMQSGSYVSFDAGPEFINSWIRKHP